MGLYMIWQHKNFVSGNSGSGSKEAKSHLCTMRETELGMMHCGLGTSLLASQRHIGECSEETNKNDKWAERLIYEDLHNKICILGSTKTSEEM